MAEDVRKGRKPRLLFSSPHCYLDPSNGAALCTRDLLELLAGRGWSCAAFCASQMDFETHKPLQEVLAGHRLPFQVHHATTGPTPFALYRYQQNGVQVSFYDSPGPASSRQLSRPAESQFLSLLERVLDRFQPDLLLTYGGNELAREIIRRARHRGLPVVFALHNFAYTDAGLFRDVDAVLVPSRFAQAHYKDRLGLACTAIPGPWDWAKARCPEVAGRYVTFVNPQPTKGIFPFVRIASELGHWRPDIPLLVVEGRGQAAWLQRTGQDLRGLSNLFVMKCTPDPRDFYRVSRLILMPSLWQESFPRVAVEALLNGIPVLGSRRGGLPEVLERAGFLFDLPERYRPESRLVPTPEEVAPWVEKIIRLWDDPALYEAERQRCLAAAEAWRPERLGNQFEEFFLQVLSGSFARSTAPKRCAPKQRVKAQATAPLGHRVEGPAGPEPARISLCMIVKNEEANLPACLRPVVGLVHETIVVDTGSTDGTKEVARQLGARVVDFTWVDSFAAARNEGLRHATGDWIFWLDADDRVDALNRDRLQRLFASLKPENAAFVMQCFCSEGPGHGDGTVVDHVRLFRNRPEIRWQYRVHEQILPAIRRLGGSVQPTDVVIHHVGYQDLALRRLKQQRDLRLLELDRAEHPHDPFILFNLGWNYFTARGPAEALPLLRQSLALSKPTDSIVRKLYSLMASCHRRLGRFAEALSACLEGRRYYPDDASLLFQEAMVRREQKDLAGAEACLERLLNGKDQPHFASVACGLRGIKARHELALVYRDLGKEKEAETQWRHALAEQPHFPSAWYGLGGLYLQQGRLAEFDTVLGELAKAEATGATGPVLTLGLRARRHLAQREFGAARTILEEATARFDQEMILWLLLSQALLREGKDPEGAEKSLRKVLTLDPGNREAANNLAILLREQTGSADSRSLVSASAALHGTRSASSTTLPR